MTTVVYDKNTKEILAVLSDMDYHIIIGTANYYIHDFSIQDVRR